MDLYDTLINDGICTEDENLDSASISRPIVSTDYETIQDPAKNDQ